MRPERQGFFSFSFAGSIHYGLMPYVAGGNVVMQVLEEVRPDLNQPGAEYKVAWFDLFRLADGRLIEHWDAAAKGELLAVMQQQQAK